MFSASPSDEEKAKILNSDIPTFLQDAEKMLERGGRNFFVGNEVKQDWNKQRHQAN